MRIALAQINPIVGDLSYNTKKILSFIKRASTLGSDLIVFPELSLLGYPPEDLLFRESFLNDIQAALHHIAKNTNDIVTILGCLDKDKKGNIYNSAAIIRNKKIVDTYHKIELPNYNVFDEKRYFTPGTTIPIYKIGSILFGVNICEDIWLDNIPKKQAEKGAQLLLNISSSPYHMGKIALRKKLIKKKSIETNSYICYTNLVGGQDELIFDGGSFIVDPKGRTLAHSPQFKEDLLVADLSIKNKQQKKANIHHNLGNLKIKQKPPFKKAVLKKTTLEEEVYNALTLATHDYISKNGFKKVIIGLSGGIDSALTAAIACDAIGSQNVISVSMPSSYSSKETQKDACILAKNLNLKLIKLKINRIFKTYIAEFKDEFKGLSIDITEENIQARIRGNILMAFSNKFNYLVLTTGNKSEVSCGYCTLYGDMAGGFSILKDVYKMLVYKLAEFKNRENEIIPKTILKRAPSAELKHNQKDSDSLPPYPILDEILKEYIENDKSYLQICKTKKYSPTLVKKILKMVDQNEYKRRQAPPGIKITSKAFGKDRRMPITNHYLRNFSIPKI